MAESPSISTVIDWLVFRSFVLFIYQQNKHISITYSATPPFLYFLSRQTALEKLRWYLNQSHSYEQNHLWDVSLSCEYRSWLNNFSKGRSRITAWVARSLLERSWRTVPVARCITNVSVCFIQLSKTATACQPVKANSRTIDFYRMTSGVAGKGKKPHPPVCI